LGYGKLEELGMNIFISHAVANKNIAQSLSEVLEATKETVTTFLASRPGDIRADEDWLGGIERALQKADTYIIILTPESVLRPWVNFEAGAAWFFKRQLVFVRIQALSTDDIPSPINSRQVYAIDVKEQLIAVLKSIGLPIAKPDLAVSKIIAQAAEDTVTGDNEPAWEGIQIDGVFYAWAGSLLGLNDLDTVSPPSSLLEEIKKRGLKPRWANMNHLSHHIERGLAQVFATDRKTWRRSVSDQNRPLMVSAQPIVGGDLGLLSGS
jgi:hypothetical protein